MNRTFRAAALALAFLLAACAGRKEPAAAPVQSANPAITFVRPFGVTSTLVTLDPNFGFTLAHGFLPKATRERSLKRAVQFILADALEERLHETGLAATRGKAMPHGARTALVVGGEIDELAQGAKRLGDRARPGHGGSRVVAEAWVDYLAPGMPPRRLLDLHEDSDRDRQRQERAADANADARLVGERIADAIAALARSRGWLAPAR